MIEDAIKTALEADATLVGYATGGIYTYSEINRAGINQRKLPNAFGAQGQLNPLIIIKARDANRIRAIVDNEAQLASFMQIVELWFYDDGDAGYGTTELMRERAYLALQGTRLDGRKIHWMREEVRERDFEQDNACYEMVEYETYSVKT